MSFLRVKRKNEDDPKEVFILASKKSKLDDVDEVPVFELTNSFVQGEDIDNVIKTTIKNYSNIKTRTFDLEKLRSKLREDNAERARENKLKVLNHVRKCDISSKEECVPIIDLGDDSDPDENGNEYVYDLYYSSTSVDFSNPERINDYCLREINEEMFLKDDSEEEVNDDEEDSNDENCWKNEYPDESDENEKVDDDLNDYLSNKLKHSHLNSDYSLSTDDSDDDIERDYYNVKFNRENELLDYYDEVASDPESD